MNTAAHTAWPYLRSFYHVEAYTDGPEVTQEWALSSGGCTWAVPASEPSSVPQLRSWADLVAEPGAWRVRWTRRKRAPRLLEKLQRAYGGEAARLGDVCREAIVFDGAADLARCLEAIRADPEVQVVRIKNRMHPATDGRWSGGFRCALPTREHAGGVHSKVMTRALLHVATGPPL